MQTTNNIPPHFSVRFADGSRMWLTTDSPTEVLLRPIFLKFIAVWVLLGAMLDRGGSDVGLLHTQQVATLWLVLGVEVMLWYGAVFTVLKSLYLRGLLASIYTPLIVMPNLIFTEMTTYYVVTALNPDTIISVPMLMTEILRDIVLLLMYDIMFSSFAAQSHPAFSRTPVNLRKKPALEHNDEASELYLQGAPPDDKVLSTKALTTTAPPVFDKPAPEPVATPPVVFAPNDPPAPAPDIRLANKLYRAGEIELIRSEDHYLAVYARGRKDIVRARMAESVAKLDIRYGVQVNRSTWVAFVRVADLVKTDNTLEAHLTDGSIEIVATLRRHAVAAADDLFLRQSKERILQDEEA